MADTSQLFLTLAIKPIHLTCPVRLFGDGNPLPFTVISALLRLGHKYNIPGLQESATIRLRACFPETLESFKNSLTTDLGFTEDGYLRFEPPLIRMRLE